MTGEPVGGPLDSDGRRLLWRCRRGMKELDVLLERFARGELPGASAGLRATFAVLLELPDPLLADYLFGYATPPEPELAELVRRIAAPAPSRWAAAASRAIDHMAVPAPVRHDPAPKRVS
ncbi:MAG: hypothetical protein JWN85_1203 [Gammaproteobacteria bacterium]|nr:hypothetical protein [Gammaproteobacteria bacterium]